MHLPSSLRLLIGAICLAASLHAEGDLISFAERGKLDQVRKCLATGANINQADFDGCTALIWSVYHRHSEITSLLLEKGADPNLRTMTENPKISQGASALHIAAGLGDNDTISRLLARGAVLEIVNGQGQTPLFVACANNRTQTAELLIRSGARLDVRDKSGKRPVEHAAAQGHFYLMGLLWNKSKKGPEERIPNPVYAKQNDFTPLGKTYKNIQLAAFGNTTGKHGEGQDGISYYYTAHPEELGARVRSQTISSLSRSGMFEPVEVAANPAPKKDTLLVEVILGRVQLYNRTSRPGQWSSDKIPDRQNVLFSMQIYDSETKTLLRSELMSYTKPLVTQNPQATDARMDEVLTSIGEYIAAYLMITARP